MMETWADIEAMTNEWGESFAPNYWETVYRTNVQSAYNAGTLMEYRNNEPPAWELLFVEDEWQSDACRSLASMVSGNALLWDKTVIKTEWHPQPVYQGKINGLRLSNDIASVLPSELAMMRNPAAKKLFQLKFAQKQLLSFDYQRDEEILKTETVQEEVFCEKEEPKGPIIICVDTSGSMHSIP